MASKWKLAQKTSGGHSYWTREGMDADLAVADGSMRVANDPASTDDGLLLVDIGRILSEGLRGSEASGIGLSFSVPLRDGARTAAGLTEAVSLAGLVTRLSRAETPVKLSIEDKFGTKVWVVPADEPTAY